MLKLSISDKLLWYNFIALYKLSRFMTFKFELWSFDKRKKAWLSKQSPGYKWSIDEYQFKESARIAIQNELDKKRKAYIGEIDQEGFIYPYYDLFDGAPVISRENFYERLKHKIFLVVYEGFIGVEKHFRCPKRFLNEFVALIHLSEAGLNVPAVLDANFHALILTTTYIRGKVLREELARKGALLRDAQLGLPTSRRDRMIMAQESIVSYNKKIAEEGLKVMDQVIDLDFIENTYKVMTQIHKKGFFIGDIKYGNIIIEEKSGEPLFIDFEGSIQLKRIKSRRVREILKEKDIFKFKDIFGLTKNEGSDLVKVWETNQDAFNAKVST